MVTPDGFPLAYEVLSGNTSDRTTLAGFLAKIESMYGKARRVWLMDQGIPKEEDLARMRADGVGYVVGTPKSLLDRMTLRGFLPPLHVSFARLNLPSVFTRGSCCSMRAANRVEWSANLTDRCLAQVAVVATTGRAVSARSCGFGGIPKTAVTLFRKRNYVKDKHLRESVGKNYESPALPLSYGP